MTKIEGRLLWNMSTKNNVCTSVKLITRDDYPRDYLVFSDDSNQLINIFVEDFREMVNNVLIRLDELESGPE